MIEYPDVICNDCAEAAGAQMPDGHLATYSLQKCGICLQEKPCTELRDWGYPRIKELDRVARAVRK